MPTTSNRACSSRPFGRASRSGTLPQGVGTTPDHAARRYRSVDMTDRYHPRGDHRRRPSIPYRLPRHTDARAATTSRSSPISTAATFVGSRRPSRSRRRARTDELVLNAIELDDRRVRVDGAPATIELDEATERLFVTPAGGVAAGEHTLVDRVRRHRSTTSCAASTAARTRRRRRRARDRDHPDAVDRLPAGVPVLGRARLQGGVRRHARRRTRSCWRSRTGPRSSRDDASTASGPCRFADTMVMSSYLVAFVVGPLEATELASTSTASRCASCTCRARAT